MQLLVNKQVDDEDKELVGAGERAWKMFVAYVTTTIIDQPETITNINVLCTKYVECLNAEGNIKEIYRVDHLKSRLKRHFGDDLTFHRPKKRNVCECVFSSSVPAGPLVKKCTLAMQAADDAAEDSVPQAGSPLLTQSSLHSPWADLFRAALYLRYDMFCLKAAQSSQLPPSKDALQKHVLRANYQAAIWHRAL